MKREAYPRYCETKSIQDLIDNDMLKKVDITKSNGIRHNTFNSELYKYVVLGLYKPLDSKTYKIITNNNISMVLENRWFKGECI